MRIFLHLPKLGIFIFMLSGFANCAWCQNQLSIKNFAIFGGDNNASLSDNTISGIEFKSNISLNGGGLVGTQTFFSAGMQVNIDGDVYANTANIGNSFTINPGSLSIFNRLNVNTTVLNIGTGVILRFPGNLSVNGSSVITSGIVDGVLTYPPGFTYSGPSPDFGTNLEVPVFPIMPAMPAVTTFPSIGTSPFVSSSQIITPGTYQGISLSGSQTVTFSGVGTYVFNTIDNSNKNTFVFDFQNSTTGVIQLYVHDNINLGSIDVSIINGGSASRIYTETHGTGDYINDFSSFTMNTSGATSASWAGTVWAPDGSIIIGETTMGSINVIDGCMWSSKKVKIGLNTSFSFAPLSSSAEPSPNALILPYYPPPADGKINTPIGSELTSLFENAGSNLQDSIIYQRTSDSVLIEVIALEDKYASTLAFLQANGLRGLINNGPASLIISGKFPIAKLLLLNTRPDLIDYVRPLYHPISNIGIVTSQGDSAMGSNLVKNGYNLTGNNVKVGVISDSYNTREVSPGISGNYAAIDVSNGDLPGSTSPVQVIKEYPYGARSDEGRAMLQIVHDIAPKAKLAFRTGFVSAGDFAQGINELGAAGCKVIVDDVTYITEPYYKDGVVAQAVDDVVATGTTYFSAAGNFGKKSYESTFDETVAPAGIRGITGRVHNFGSDISPNPFQTLNLSPGTYTLVLQWEDDIYSLGTRTSSAGAKTDLDVFLVDDLGATLFGFNRNNIDTDPIEVLPFTVTTTTKAKLIIGKASGANVRFKYIVFRGELTFSNYNGSSTLVGQANASGAIAVGAVLYTNTPPYGLATPTIASFSSVGGARVNGILRNKPDITAPNGVNTTVNFNSFDLENDGFSNFYGTSAAAPHAAAAAALIIEGQQKFLGESITPASLRNLLRNTAMPMNGSGYDAVTGYGFLNPFGAMKTFANPVPVIESLNTSAPVTRPVTQPFTVTVEGKGLTTATKVYLRETPITTTFVNSEKVTAVIPPFTDNPSIQLFNPAIVDVSLPNTVSDGGLSESLYFFSTSQKKHIIVKADNKSKKYGEKLPFFTSTVTVDGTPVQNTNVTLAELKLNQLKYSTPASSKSNVASYFIRPIDPLNPAIPADALLLEKYTYEFIDGLLTIVKLPLKVTPRDTTLTYGQRIRGIKFNYLLDVSANIQNPDSLRNAIRLSHSAFIIDSLYALVNKDGASSRALVNADLLNLSILVSGGSGASSRALVNNGSGTTLKSYIVDINVGSIFNYINNPASSPLVSGGNGASSRALVNTGPLINGTASVIVNGGNGATSRALVNGDASLLNSNTAGGTSNTNIAVIISSADVPASTNNSIKIRAVNMLTSIAAGTQTIVPAAFLSENFDITYGLGKCIIKQAPLNVKTNFAYSDNGKLPNFTSTITGYQFQDAARPVSGPVYTVTPSYKGEPGVYFVKPSALKFPGDSNYLKNYIANLVYVNPYATAKKINIKVLCVDKVYNHASGLKYVAHFSYENDNKVPVYVPKGANNHVTFSGTYVGNFPELFLTGTHCFDIYFNGEKLTWALKTLERKSRKTVVASCSYKADKCKANAPELATKPDHLNTQNPENTLQKRNGPGANGIFQDKKGMPVEKMEVFPNPATDKLMVTTTGEFTQQKSLTVIDVNGKQHSLQVTKRSRQMLWLDISALRRGSYFLRIKQSGKYKTLSFIKL